MKIQIFALAAATSLACSLPAAAETIIKNNVKPVTDIQVNTAIKKTGITQGTPQFADIINTQNTILKPTSLTSKSSAAPKVIVNTNITPLTQVQVNTAVLSNGVTQGGPQTANVQNNQNGLAVSRGADGAYIYNYNYTSVYQQQYNNALYSNGIKQGGGQGVNVNSGQNGIAK